ncbi:carbohydrate-binding family 9-like protein [uncultured Mucilaginibacter sp.]|uniref:carbohydrate-binding family 9-like protein n=1 Tax=uncultured Mucilaginibacter sp. TaxID=797541 RepID=UPI0025D70255|nr:carbohydrate-binding family 9-like protein [uncultured Mucilaginibacter sp.]
MSLLKVPYLPGIHYGSSALDSADLFSQTKPNKLTCEPWPAVFDRPEVTFNIGYGDDAIFLAFCVKEKHFKAIYQRTNEPVYKDSCVEFFITFDDDETYYNFEFNAIGTALVGYGLPGDRELLPALLISDIKSTASNKTVRGDSLPFEWELSLVIPFSLFYKHSISTLKGMACKANFYKCGDDLPEPHFLCWNNIIADKPNFHLPQYFGALIFEQDKSNE